MIRGINLHPDDRDVEPLFAHNARLWLRVWAATQCVATAIALFAVVASSGGTAAFLRSSAAMRMIVLAVLLFAYHIIGISAYRVIIRRTWSVLLFVPIGWALVISTLQLNPGFGLLILGSILQGFIFLPFAWAIGTLGVVVVSFTALAARAMPWNTPATALSRLVSIPVTGVMIATVLLYIHRTNREAVLRTRLLRQLDEAQHHLADRAREAGVQAERQRFARDIHDTLAQGFTSVIKHLEAIELSLPASGENNAIALSSVRPHLVHAQSVSRDSLADIRRLVLALRPLELTEAPLAAALERIVARWSDASGVTASFAADLLTTLQPDAEVIFLRATQEALSNVSRHANAQSVSVTLRSVDGLALLTIEDDGVGFEQHDTPGAEKMGLSGMRERVRRFGGHLLIDSTPGQGTSLTIAMPLAAISATASAATVER